MRHSWVLAVSERQDIYEWRQRAKLRQSGNKSALNTKFFFWQNAERALPLWKTHYEKYSITLWSPWLAGFLIPIEPIIQLSLLCHAVSHRWQLVFRITALHFSASLCCHSAHHRGISLKRVAFISQFLSQLINAYYIPMLIYFFVKKSHYFWNIFIFVFLYFFPPNSDCQMMPGHPLSSIFVRTVPSNTTISCVSNSSPSY